MTDQSKRLLEKAAFDAEEWRERWPKIQNVISLKVAAESGPKFHAFLLGVKRRGDQLLPLIQSLLEDREALLGAVREANACEPFELYDHVSRAIADSEARMKSLLDG